MSTCVNRAWCQRAGQEGLASPSWTKDLAWVARWLGVFGVEVDGAAGSWRSSCSKASHSPDRKAWKRDRWSGLEMVRAPGFLCRSMPGRRNHKVQTRFLGAVVRGQNALEQRGGPAPNSGSRVRELVKWGSVESGCGARRSSHMRILCGSKRSPSVLPKLKS